jgi:multidrug efflux pump subunit AcrA (membrane-fusion protein)
LWLAGIVLIAGCRPVAKADDPAADDEAAPVKVEVRPVVRAALDETVEVLGTTQPLRSKTARVTTAVEGRVAEILPEEKDPMRSTLA